ncbi:hypothetical protein FG167_07270 [Lacinutrix sp. WUR7]|uniref:hypothetical protein n=1 Tax=Lacinutrix sp. WUR7 TaxID=2653681 RepID=UPI00193DB2BD|nr:hypothetical protein [Lacinutrix sp. WUR7]QRM89044.1 hypothetical protein FG167_07270 [Lacinutrix sp. WUR7]
MKTSKRLFQVLLVALFFNIATTFAQDTYYVTIHVETDKITSRNKLEVCYFTWEKPNGEITKSVGNIEDFNIEVNPEDLIVWNGVSTTNPQIDIVNVTSINHHGGYNVFGRNVLRGNGQTPEVVIGKVNPNTKGRIQKYTIKITVYLGGRKRGNFSIDPKITVKL